MRCHAGIHVLKFISWFISCCIHLAYSASRNTCFIHSMSRVIFYIRFTKNCIRVSGFMLAAEICLIWSFKALYCLKNKIDVIHCGSNIVLYNKPPKIEPKNKYRYIPWSVAQAFGHRQNWMAVKKLRSYPCLKGKHFRKYVNNHIHREMWCLWLLRNNNQLFSCL